VSAEDWATGFLRFLDAASGCGWDEVDDEFVVAAFVVVVTPLDDVYAALFLSSSDVSAEGEDIDFLRFLGAACASAGDSVADDDEFVTPPDDEYAAGFRSSSEVSAEAANGSTDGSPLDGSSFCRSSSPLLETSSSPSSL
jgi:hypothetical protein